MAKSISFTEVTAVGSFVQQTAAVQNSKHNPVERTSRVSLFAAQAAAGDGNVFFSLGAEDHASDVSPNVRASPSTRDDLISSGIAFAGQKITVGVRGLAIGTVNGLVVIEPI